MVGDAATALFLGVLVIAPTKLIVERLVDQAFVERERQLMLIWPDIDLGGHAVLGSALAALSRAFIVEPGEAPLLRSS